MTEPIGQLLPAFYRIRDAEASGVLEAVLAVLDREAGVVEADIGQLLDDWFVETCQPWVVPYIGDLLGVRPLRPVDGVVLPRAYVANTIAYRRRKGTAPVLEQLAADVTGWRARVVEYFRTLSTTQHLAHLRPSPTQVPDLRDSAALEQLDGPFDTAAHTVDVRRITAESGDHNIGNIGLFLWRLSSYPVVDAAARPAVEPSDGTYWIDPLGRDVPLFNSPEPERTITHLATEHNVPGRLRRRALHDEAEAIRQAMTDDAPADRSGYLGRRPVVEIAVRRTPTDPLVTIPAEEIQVCRLDDWHRPPTTRSYQPTGGGIARIHPISVAVDPELGRLSFPTGETPSEVVVSSAYGFSGEVGAGPYPRLGRLRWHEPEERPVTWQRGVSADPAVVADDPDNLRGTLDEAIAEWNAHQAAQPGAFGVIAVLDSLSHPVTATVEVGAGSLVAVVGAAWPRSSDGTRRVGGFVADGVRPHVRGDLSVRGTADADDANPGGAAVDGLLIEGDLRVRQGQLGDLHIGHTTIEPGRGRFRVETGTGGRNPRLDATIERSICGGVRVRGDEPRVSVIDSIVDDRDNPAAIDATGAVVALDSVTVLGAVRARRLDASNSILFGAVDVERVQEGCLRYSYVPQTPGRRAPRRHRCQPDHAVSLLPEPAEQARAAARIVPLFTSTVAGEPGYGQLGRQCAAEIAAGADDDAEMGAFRHLAQPQRLSNLATVLDEYLPVGLEAGPLFVT